MNDNEKNIIKKARYVVKKYQDSSNIKIVKQANAILFELDRFLRCFEG